MAIDPRKEHDEDDDDEGDDEDDDEDDDDDDDDADDDDDDDDGDDDDDDDDDFETPRATQTANHTTPHKNRETESRPKPRITPQHSGGQDSKQTQIPNHTALEKGGEGVPTIGGVEGGGAGPAERDHMCICVCVCVYIYIYTHTQFVDQVNKLLQYRVKAATCRPLTYIEPVIIFAYGAHYGPWDIVASLLRTDCTRRKRFKQSECAVLACSCGLYSCY